MKKALMILGLLLIAIFGNAQTSVSIYDIQYTTDAAGDSPYIGQQVTVTGTVTDTISGAYWIQDGSGAWNGVYVYDDIYYPNPGDNITITAVVDEFYDLTELKTITSFTVNSSGNTIDPVEISTAEVDAEQYESVLVKVVSAECVNANAGYGMWGATDGSGITLVDDKLYPFSAILENHYDITGIVEYSYSEWKILPRFPDDIQLSLAELSSTAETIKVMYYNLLNYPGTASDRYIDFQTIMQDAMPDIIVVNELESEAGANTLLNNALNTNGINYYQRADFIDGFGTDNMLFYNSNKLGLAAQSEIATNLRDINHYKVYYKAPDLASTGDTTYFNVFSCHLKASMGFESDRLSEIQNFFSYLQNNSQLENIIIGGDFNFYNNTTETAYLEMVNHNSFRMYDPIGSGYWHNNIHFMEYLTQCTRVLTGNGGGATGGIDDRFDFIFFNDDLINGTNNSVYKANSYTVFGNDGNADKYGNDINAYTSSIYSSTVLDALYNCSDHLPVIAEFVIGGTPALSSAAEILNFTLPEQTGQANINSGNASVDIEVLNGTDISNLTPDITVSAYASISPLSGTIQDFTTPVTYTVTAQDGSQKVWTITVTEAPAASITSIYDIQYTANVSGDSPYADQSVLTAGTVTAVGSGSYWIQDGPGPWNGLYVFDSDHTPTIGDSLILEGEITEYYNLTELRNLTSYNSVSAGNTVHPTEVSTGSAGSEEYESVFVTLTNAECINTDAGYGMWEVNDGTGNVLIDDILQTFTPTLGSIYTVTGPVFYSYDEWKVLPRDLNDIVFTYKESITNSDLSIYPNPVHDILYFRNDEKIQSVKLSNNLGQTINTVCKNGKLQLNDLETGMYILRIQFQDNSINSYKIIKN